MHITNYKRKMVPVRHIIYKIIKKKVIMAAEKYRNKFKACVCI